MTSHDPLAILGLRPGVNGKITPPLRRVVTVGAGTSHLECGHCVTTKSRFNGVARGKIVRARCETCLPTALRLVYINRRRSKRAQSESR